MGAQRRLASIAAALGPAGGSCVGSAAASRDATAAARRSGDARSEAALLEARMPPDTPEDDRLPPRSENRGFR